MDRSFRFLWQFSAPNIGVLAGFAAIVTVGTHLTGGRHDLDNMFATYFGMFPLMSLMILFMLSYALCTSNLELAVSFGAQRRDFFWALQEMMLVYALVVWGLQAVMSRLPDLLGWQGQEHWDLLLGQNMDIFTYMLMAMTVFAMGCVCGLVFVRSRLWGTVVMLAFVLIGVATVVMQLFTVNHRHTGLWGDLPWILTAALVVILVGCEVFLWRYIRRYCVR